MLRCVAREHVCRLQPFLPNRCKPQNLEHRTRNFELRPSVKKRFPHTRRDGHRSIGFQPVSGQSLASETALCSSPQFYFGAPFYLTALVLRHRRDAYDTLGAGFQAKSGEKARPRPTQTGSLCSCAWRENSSADFKLFCAHGRPDVPVETFGTWTGLLCVA